MKFKNSSAGRSFWRVNGQFPQSNFVFKTRNQLSFQQISIASDNEDVCGCRVENGPKETKIIDWIIYVASVNAAGKRGAYSVESLKSSKKAAKFTYSDFRHGGTWNGKTLFE